MSNNERQYINAAFLKEVYNKNDQLLISFGIKKEEFIKELESLPASSTGFVNLTIGTQKKDKKKFSLWVDDYERKGANVPSSQQTGYRPAPKQSSSYSSVQQGPPSGAASYGSGSGPVDDSLPF